MDLLDVSTYPTTAPYGEGELQLNLAAIPRRMRTGFDELVKAGLIKPNDSFGCAVARPCRDGDDTFQVWDADDPSDFLWFVTGWGPNRDMYVANAIRKLRPSLREGQDTLLMRCDPETYVSGEAASVKSVDADGNFPWGDFFWGGAVFVHVGGLCIPVAVSCLYEVEDDAIAKLIGGSVGAEMLKIDMPDEFGPNS